MCSNQLGSTLERFLHRTPPWRSTVANLRMEQLLEGDMDHAAQEECESLVRVLVHARVLWVENAVSAKRPKDPSRSRKKKKRAKAS